MLTARQTLKLLTLGLSLLWFSIAASQTDLTSATLANENPTTSSIKSATQSAHSTTHSLLSQPQSLHMTQLASFFTDHMVLQAGKKLPVWGKDKPWQRVTVLLGGMLQSAQTGANGIWRVDFPPMDPGGPYTLKVEGTNSVLVRDVLIGDVWVCAGQTNMAFPVRDLFSSDQLAAQPHALIRLFRMKRDESQNRLDDARGTWTLSLHKALKGDRDFITSRSLRLQALNLPLSQPEGVWTRSTAKTVDQFSAIGYLFGSQVQRKQNIPVGLILSATQGDQPRNFVPDSPDLRQILKDWDMVLQRYNQNTDSVPFAIEEAFHDELSRHHPASQFNAMIEPLTYSPIRGVIWYEVQENPRILELYNKLFPALIHTWRRKWQDPMLPFLFVQQARGDSSLEESSSSSKEAQLQTWQAMRETGMVVGVDAGDDEGIQPRKKKPVADRLVLAAENLVYRQNKEFSGPVFSTMQVRLNVAIVRFDHCAEGLKTWDGGPLTGFMVAGMDRVFYPAQAKIEGQSVLVSSQEVDKPVAVRYGWENSSEGNLSNMENLPAMPFRTDRWSVATQKDDLDSGKIGKALIKMPPSMRRRP